MNVLSLFDGMSCGQIALNRSGVKYDNYFASEVDKYAMAVTQHNYPNTIQIGDVRDIDVAKLPRIDLLQGGSPCQNFSFGGNIRGMVTKCNKEILTLDDYLELKRDGFQFDGQSYLFWEYVRILKDIQKINPDVKFLLENVRMLKKWMALITNSLGIIPIEINSNLVSAQSRRRLYWTNIYATKDLAGYSVSNIPQPKDKGLLLKDILESEVDKKYYLSDKMIKYIKDSKWDFRFRIKDILSKSNIILSREGTQRVSTYINGADIRRGEGLRVRRLTPIECERLQTVPDNYTSIVSDSQRYKMLGNGWTVDVITHIYSFLLK